MNDPEPKNLKSYIGTTVVIVVILFVILISLSAILRRSEPPKQTPVSTLQQNAPVFMVISNVPMLRMGGAVIMSIPKKQFTALTNEYNLRIFNDTIIFYKETEQSRNELLAVKKAREDEIQKNIEILKKNNEGKK